MAINSQLKLSKSPR